MCRSCVRPTAVRRHGRRSWPRSRATISTPADAAVARDRFLDKCNEQPRSDGVTRIGAKRPPRRSDAFRRQAVADDVDDAGELRAVGPRRGPNVRTGCISPRCPRRAGMTAPHVHGTGAASFLTLAGMKATEAGAEREARGGGPAGASALLLGKIESRDLPSSARPESVTLTSDFGSGSVLDFSPSD